MKSHLATLAFVTATLAASRTSPPEGCLVVSKSPSSGQYSTVQKAVDAASSGKRCIFINQGTYDEHVVVPSGAAGLIIYGYTSNVNGYAGNGATITGSGSRQSSSGDEGTATLDVRAANFKLYNVNVANTYGQGSQAVAMASVADSGFYGCQFSGFQDTLFAQAGHQLYSQCLITGATDFIFGQSSLSWFNKCDIRVLAASLGYIAANGRTSPSVQSKFIFDQCDIAAASGNNVPNGAYYLGRPWGAYAQAVFQRTSMSSVINPAGWSIWDQSDPHTSNCLLAEYKNTGPGSKGTRASFSKQLSSAVSIDSILGSDYNSAGYVDGSYL